MLERPVILASLKQAGNCKQVSGLALVTKSSSATVNGITVQISFWIMTVLKLQQNVDGLVEQWSDLINELTEQIILFVKGECKSTIHPWS